MNNKAWTVAVLRIEVENWREKYKSYLYVEYIKVLILPAICVMFGLSHISFSVDRHDRKWILSPLKKKRFKEIKLTCPKSQT